jgi:hypothetical protein
VKEKEPEILRKSNICAESTGVKAVPISKTKAVVH